MSESEIQKLISIFLGLAIIVSSVVFVFSDNLVNSYKSNYGGSLNNSSQNNSENSDVKNAFVESVKDLPPSYSTISLNDEFQLSGNLTDDFASYAAREIVKANPNGPEIDENGDQNITIPNVESLTTNFATNTLSKINLPDWDKEVEKIYSKINIIDNSKESIANYLNDFNNIYEKYLAKTDFENLLNSSTDYRVALESISQVNDDFYKEFLNLKVPDNFLEFHKSLLRILTYQKQLLQNKEKLNTDPLYVYYSIENNQSKISKSFEDFEKEAEKIKSLGYTYKNNFSKNDVLEKIFFIQKAHAFLGLGDIVFDPSAVAQLIKQNLDKITSWLKKLATEILKDQLIHRLVQQTIRWVQGWGKPQFVTNWQQFLTDAVSRGAGEALYQSYPRICQPFRPLIQIAFQNIGNIYDEYVACTLGDIVNNLNEFYNDFKYGGWIAYGQILNPQGNFWGQLIITNDIIAQKAAQEKETQKSDVETSKGFLSTKRCVKGQSVSCDFNNADEQKECDSQYLSQSYTKPKYELDKDGSGTAWYSICDKDGWENTTPGALVADVVGNTLPMGPIGRIVNAEDVTALVSALVNSGLNKLILAGQKGLTSLFNSKEEPAKQNTVTDVNDPCFGEVIGSDSYNECRGITSGGGLYQTDISEQQTSLFQQAKNILKQLQDGVKSNNEWLDAASTIQNRLEQIGGCASQSNTQTSTQTTALCPNLSTEACALNTKIEELKNKMTIELERLKKEIQNIQAIMCELYMSNQSTPQQFDGITCQPNTNKLTPQRLTEISNELGRYTDPSTNAPIQRLPFLDRLQSAINENIFGSPQCQTPLPEL